MFQMTTRMERQNLAAAPPMTRSRTVCVTIFQFLLAVGLTAVFLWTLFDMKHEMSDDCFTLKMDIEKLKKEIADLRIAVIKSVGLCSRLKEPQTMEVIGEDINYEEEEIKDLDDNIMDSSIEEPPIEPGYPNPMTNTLVRKERSLQSLEMANDTSLSITNSSDYKPMPKLKRLAMMMMLNDSSDSLILNNSLISSESAMPSILPHLKRHRLMKNSKQKDINTSLDKNFKRIVDDRNQLGDENEAEYLSRNSFVADHFGSNHATNQFGHSFSPVNMKVQHSDGRHKHWESKLQLSNVNKYFSMKDGNLTVKQTGLYFVYAQRYDSETSHPIKVVIKPRTVIRYTWPEVITAMLTSCLRGKIDLTMYIMSRKKDKILYSNLHDMNGYQIFHNSEIVLECLTTNIAPENKANISSEPRAKNGPETKDNIRQLPKPNTCFTAGLIYCKSDDKLSIRTAQSNREIILNPSQSFFGLLKVGD